MELSFENYTILKNQKLSRAAIADQFNIPEWKLKKLIAQYGWGKKPPIIANENLFSDFSENCCYWAGFLAADGNVDSDNRIRITLNYDDTLHLQKFKDALGSTHSISSNTDKYYRSSFEFTNKNLREDLETLFFITPNKSLTLKFPEYLEHNELRHYIRGYFDGDGTVGEIFSNKNSRTSSIFAGFCSGSKDFAIKLFERLQFENIVNGGSLHEFDNKMNIKFNTNDAKLLLTYMYEGSSVYLDRKYALYEKLVINNNRQTR